MKCSVSKLCGGCTLLKMKYELQGQQKRQQVVDLLKENHLPLKVGEVHMAQQPLLYRNKVIVGFAKDKNKKVFSGLYAPKSHKVINTSGCRMQPKIVNEIIDEITHLVDSMKIQLYSPKTGTGLLRHVLIRYAQNTDQIMVVFVTSSREFPSRKNMVKALTSKFPQITTILQNVNPRDTSIVLQDETMVLYGKGTITDILCGMKITISPNAFYQINHDQCEVLYNLGKEMLDLKDTDKVLDTYCGVGTIGLFLSKFCKEVTGVEINKDAVENARWNARQNDVKNIRFVAMDSTRFMMEARRNHQFYNDIVLDPPRAGTTKEFIECACSLKPDKILYISCDPRTQIRDLKQFRTYGYITKELQLVDMFPNTDHIESLCVLTKDPKRMASRSLLQPKKGHESARRTGPKSFDRPRRYSGTGREKRKPRNK